MKNQLELTSVWLVWNGSELNLDQQTFAVRYTCGDLFCGANVRRISELSKEKYLEEKVN